MSFLLLCGCGSVISPHILKEVDRTITPEMVQKEPDHYRGKRVVWGGIIVLSENLEKTTIIEVLGTELSSTDRPTLKNPDGRFLIEKEGYLDTLIYSRDKRITVAGIIKGIRKRNIGKMEYTFPVLTPLEIKLFEPVKEPYPYTVPPWWYYHYPPWSYPFYCPP